MESQETNNKINNQKTGCTVYLRDGISQNIPNINFNDLMKSILSGSKNGWIEVSGRALIRVKDIIEVYNEEQDNEQ